VAETDGEINIDDNGSVHIYSNNGESLKRSRHDHIFQQLRKSVVIVEHIFVRLRGSSGELHEFLLSDWRFFIYASSRAFRETL
jgi:hypothetical protein